MQCCTQDVALHMQTDQIATKRLMGLVAEKEMLICLDKTVNHEKGNGFDGQLIALRSLHRTSISLCEKTGRMQDDNGIPLEIFIS